MEKPKKIYVAQTSQGVLSVVNEHYPGATAYVKKEEPSGDREVKKSYILEVLTGQRDWYDIQRDYRQELIDFVKEI